MLICMYAVPIILLLIGIQRWMKPTSLHIDHKLLGLYLQYEATATHYKGVYNMILQLILQLTWQKHIVLFNSSHLNIVSFSQQN